MLRMKWLLVQQRGKIARRHRPIGNLVLLRRAAKISSVTNSHYWNDALSIGIGGWWRQTTIWGELLVCFFSVICLCLRGCSSCRALDLRSAPPLDVINDHAKHAKTWRKCTNNASQKLKQHYQPPTPTEREFFNSACLRWWSCLQYATRALRHQLTRVRRAICLFCYVVSRDE